MSTSTRTVQWLSIDESASNFDSTGLHSHVASTASCQSARALPHIAQKLELTQIAPTATFVLRQGGVAFVYTPRPNPKPQLQTPVEPQT